MEQVLVLMSTFNGEKYLREQLDSILNQHNVEFKILIRDDGSSDSTRDILIDYQKRFPSTINVIFGENLGYKLSFRTLIAEGISRYKDIHFFSFSDQDDVWLPDKLLAGLNAITPKDQSKPITYCCNTTLVNQSLEKIHECWSVSDVEISKPRCMIENFATGCTMVFNKSAAKLFLSAQPSYQAVHDYWMFQICTFFGEAIFDPTPHILYRQHGNNQIGRPNFIARMKNKITGNYKKRAIELRNQAFLSSFQHLLSEDDIKLLRTITDYKKTFRHRFKLLFNRTIKYSSLEKNFFFSLKIIFGII